MLAVWLIRGGVSLTMIVFGLNEMANPNAWLQYIPESLRRSSPIAPATSMRLHALGNIAFGLFLIAGNFHPLIAAWVAIIWWVSILPFAFKVKWDIGMRDLTIVAALAALISLLNIK